MRPILTPSGDKGPDGSARAVGVGRGCRDDASAGAGLVIVAAHLKRQLSSPISVMSRIDRVRRSGIAVVILASRRWRLPRLRPRIVRSPVDLCLGTNPSPAAKSRPLANAVPAPTVFAQPVLGCDPHLEDEARRDGAVYHPTRQHCRRPAFAARAPQGGWMRCAGVLLSGAEGDPEVLKPRKSLASRKISRSIEPTENRLEHE